MAFGGRKQTHFLNGMGLFIFSQNGRFFKSVGCEKHSGEMEQNWGGT
jgi:hypothetical protein